MTDRVRRLIEHYFAENNGIGATKRTVARIVKKLAGKAGISKPVSPHVLTEITKFFKAYLNRN